MLCQKIKLVNLTPHAVTILNGDGSSIVVPPSGCVARITTATLWLGSFGGVEFFAQPKDGPIIIEPLAQETGLRLLERTGERTAPGETTGLPPEVPSEHDEHPKVFIVSTLVRLAHPERRDLASPGELVRNEAGQPIGCRGLIVNR